MQNLLFSFGHHYTHHQGLRRIIQVVATCGTWCFGLQVVGLVWSCGLCVWFAGLILYNIDIIFKFLPHMCARVWQEIEYRIDVCRVTCGAHVEHL
jgi:hypothetical protein